jgi:phospholipid transport system transporter-binding protein
MRLDATELDMRNAAQVAAAGIDAIRAGDSNFDLSAVRTCDSSAVATVLAWQREAQARGAQLRLSGLPADLISLATVYGVAPLMNLGAEPGR